MASIAVGADDAGAPLKERLAAYLQQQGHQIKGFGNGAGRDYPDVAAAGHRLSDLGGDVGVVPPGAVEVAETVARGEHDRVLLACGTGLGMAITANKVPGPRRHRPRPLLRRTRPHGPMEDTSSRLVA